MNQNVVLKSIKFELKKSNAFQHREQNHTEPETDCGIANY